MMKLRSPCDGHEFTREKKERLFDRVMAWNNGGEIMNSVLGGYD